MRILLLLFCCSYVLLFLFRSVFGIVSCEGMVSGHWVKPADLEAFLPQLKQ